MKVTQMQSHSGKAVANQFIIHGDDGSQTFQSYNSLIARIEPNGQVVLDEKFWDYSRTTSKYLNMFLGGQAKGVTQQKIDSGEYVLGNLN